MDAADIEAALRCLQKQIDELSAFVIARHPDVKMQAGALNALRAEFVDLLPEE